MFGRAVKLKRKIFDSSKRAVSLTSLSVLILLVAIFYTSSVISVKATHPGTVFEDDFESYGVGTFPSAGGWELWYSGAGDGYQKVVNTVSFSPTKSLQLLGWGEEGGSHEAVIVAYPLDWSSESMAYSVYVMVDEVCTFDSSAVVGLGKRTPVGITRCTEVRFYSDGMIKTVAGGEVIPLQPYEADTWYKIEVVLDTTTDTFSVWIDDELKGLDFNTIWPSSEIEAFTLTSNYANTKVYFDNVKLFGETPPHGPTAKISYSPAAPKVNETVNFDASSSSPGWNGTQESPIVSYTWDFGDGATGTGVTATHTYTSEGTYTVTLNVMDNQGLWDTASKTVTVLPPPQPYGPTAHFTFNPSTPFVESTVSFDASASLPGFNSYTTVPIANYTWDFGDGTPVTTINPTVTHTYTTEGTYTVSLTVTCEDDVTLISEGLTSDTASQNVTVSLPPPVFATVSVVPSYIKAPPPGVGDTFTVDVNIENVTDLSGWAIGMTWNSSVLECLSFTVDYSFFGPAGQTLTIPGTIDNTLGTVYPPYSAALTTEHGVTGSGILATVEFRVKDAASTWINLTVDGLSNSADEAIPYTVVNGYFDDPPLLGDADGDYQVNLNDLAILAKSWYKQVGDPGYDARADFTNDGEVNIYDLIVLAKNWYRGVP